MLVRINATCPCAAISISTVSCIGQHQSRGQQGSGGARPCRSSESYPSRVTSSARGAKRGCRTSRRACASRINRTATAAYTYIVQTCRYRHTGCEEEATSPSTACICINTAGTAPAASAAHHQDVDYGGDRERDGSAACECIHIVDNPIDAIVGAGCRSSPQLRRIAGIQIHGLHVHAHLTAQDAVGAGGARAHVDCGVGNAVGAVAAVGRASGRKGACSTGGADCRVRLRERAGLACDLCGRVGTVVAWRASRARACVIPGKGASCAVGAAACVGQRNGASLAC